MNGWTQRLPVKPCAGLASRPRKIRPIVPMEDRICTNRIFFSGVHSWRPKRSSDMAELVENMMLDVHRSQLRLFVLCISRTTGSIIISSSQSRLSIST
jgi:hypothetical protein